MAQYTEQEQRELLRQQAFYRRRAQKRKRKKRIRLAFAAAFILVMGLVTWRVALLFKGHEEAPEDIPQNLPSQHTPAEDITENRADVDTVLGIPLKTAYISPDLEGRPGIKRKVKYIVIHETGNPVRGANAQSHSVFLQGGGEGSTSWHYTVDDHEIYHHIPDNEVAWHAGDRLRETGGNLNGIGVELCTNVDGDFDKTFVNGAKLTAYLLKAYDLDISAVKQHGDFMEKNCPEHIRDQGRWNEFIALVKRYRKEV